MREEIPRVLVFRLPLTPTSPYARLAKEAEVRVRAKPWATRRAWAAKAPMGAAIFRGPPSTRAITIGALGVPAAVATAVRETPKSAVV